MWVLLPRVGQDSKFTNVRLGASFSGELGILGGIRGKIVAPSAGAGEERRKKKRLQSLSAPGDARAEGRCIPLWDGEVCGVWRGASLALCPPWCPKGHERFPPTSPGGTPGRQSCGPEPEQLLCCGVLPGQPWHCQPCREGRAQPRGALHACRIGSASATAGRCWR